MSERMNQSRHQTTVPKVGTEVNIRTPARARLAKALENRVRRKSVLTLPREFEAAHQDKYFMWVPYSDFKNNGGYHPQGYQLFKSDEDSESLTSSNFMKSTDGLIHRNEMVLTYISQDEHKERQLDEMILNKRHNIESLLDKDPNMRGFSPSVKEKREIVTEEDLKEALKG